MEKRFAYEQLKNSEVYKLGCVAAHSDHSYYREEKEARRGKSSFRFSLNGLWKFHYARNYHSTIAGFEKEEYCCKDWEQIRVPSHMQLEGYDAPQYVNVQYPWEGHETLLSGEVPERFNPVGSYVKYFEVPDCMKEERIFLVMEGVESAAAIWLNGVYLGYHEDSFTPVELELTEALKDGENKLAVQVFKWCSGSWCEDQDFFRFSGIYREVFLQSIPDVHISDLQIRALPDESLKKGEFTLSLKTDGKGKVRLWLREKGTVVYMDEKELEQETLFYQEFANPLLWSAEKPDLYELDLEVLDASGKTKEWITEQVGFRRFEMKDSVMCINGKRIVFSGVNRHEFSSIRGRAVSEEELKKDLITMKQHNINAIRTSHYPNKTLLYRLCDRYGIYVMDEMNLESHGTWEKFRETKDYDSILPNDRPEWRSALMERAASMYERDKNHASILIWSCGNESFCGSVIFEISQYFRQKDPTRLVHYEGASLDRRYPKTSDMESQMYITVENIEKFLKEHPEKPFLLCEYTHAMGNSCGGMDRYIELSERERLYQGGFIWDYIDQSLWKKNRYGQEFQAYGGDFYDRPSDYSFCGNGIVYGGDREPSPKMQEIKYLYQGISVKVKEQEVEIQNKYLFLGTDNWECRVVLEKEGAEVFSCVLETEVAPLSSKTYPLPVKKQEEEGNYTVTVSFHLRKDEIWAKRGFEIAFGQYAYCVEREKQVRKPSFRISESVRNIGVQGENFEALFSLHSGGLVSYRYGGIELLEKMPKPNFWRAPVENDLGNLMPMRYAQWKIASLYGAAKKPGEVAPVLLPYKIERRESSLSVQFTYRLPTTPEAHVLLTYEVYGDGEIVTTLEYDPVKALGDMPEFGVLFTLNADYDQVTWYGLGPEETYVDRKCGGKVGLYQKNVKDNMAAYLVPQECGNKEEVRYAKVTDRRGRGLLFRADKETGSMNFSALPYTPHQMEEAAHDYELPPVHHTIIRVAKAQMGVGGDDSWGARPHKEHLIPVDKKIVFRFSFRGI